MKRVQREVLLPSSVYKSSPEDGIINFLRNPYIFYDTVLHQIAEDDNNLYTETSQCSLTDCFQTGWVELWDCSRIENWKRCERKLSKRN